MKPVENESLLPKTSLSSVFYVLASLALVIIGLIFFSGILEPLIIAFFIWFIINQLKETLTKIRIKGKALPGILSSILAFVLIYVILSLISALLIVNIEGISNSMPRYMENLDHSFGEVSAFLNNPEFIESLEKWIDNLDLTGMATDMVNSFAGFMGNIAVVAVYVIFFIIEYTTYRLKLEKLFLKKGKQYQIVKNSLHQIKDSISSFIWQKTLISIMTGVISYGILLIMGVEFAYLWSFLIFILNFIPYIGPLFSSLFPALFAVVITGDPMQFIYVFAAMMTVQIILGNFVEPKMMGKGTNLGPVTVIVALAFWGMLWGIVGMMLAVPITAVFVIILSQISSTRFMAIILSEKGNIPEIES